MREIEGLITEINGEGLTVIIVEQNALAALRLADRCAILDNGGVVFAGEPSQVLESESLRREYLAI